MGWIRADELCVLEESAFRQTVLNFAFMEVWVSYRSMDREAAYQRSRRFLGGLSAWAFPQMHRSADDRCDSRSTPVPAGGDWPLQSKVVLRGQAGRAESGAGQLAGPCGPASTFVGSFPLEGCLQSSAVRLPGRHPPPSAGFDERSSRTSPFDDPRAV